MLKLKAAPTFTADIKVPTPDGTVTFKGTFKHMPKDQFADFVKKERSADARPDDQIIMDIMTNWSDVEVEFSVENVKLLCQEYHAFGKTIVETYVEKLTQYRQGN